MIENPTFIHLTDLHVGEPSVEDKHLYSDTTATLRAILADIGKLQPKPKFIIASGDLTNRGDVDSYKHLKALFDEAALDIPVLFGLGNHDTREGFYQGLLGRTDNLDAPYFHDQVIDGIHVIVLDSSTPKKVGGTIESEQFAWLAEALDRNPELPKIIAVHHAPALDQIETMEWESISFADTARLKDALAGRKNVIGMFCGHIHYDRVSNWYGVPVIVGIGQHMATDVLWLHEGLRGVTGASFVVGTIRESGLTVTFAPQASERRELMSFTFTGMAEMLKAHEAELQAAE